MQIPPTFEIRVALIGYVSVGKTTVLNALFGAKYGEVAMNRTTAVVNNFRVAPNTTKDGDKDGASVDTPPAAAETSQGEEGQDNDAAAGKTKREAPNEATRWATQVDSPRSPSSTLQETIQDNAAHRNSETVMEKTYEILLDQPLHEMRRDTKLVVVDIPGINEAGTGAKYKDYVNDNWHTFDIAVVVVDGRQGVNTEEQLDLIKLIDANTRNTKEIPIVLLLNKIDDPHDNDQKVLIDEFRRAVESIFGVSDRKRALEQLLNKQDKQATSTPLDGNNADSPPVFKFGGPPSSSQVDSASGLKFGTQQHAPVFGSNTNSQQQRSGAPSFGSGGGFSFGSSTEVTSGEKGGPKFTFPPPPMNKVCPILIPVSAMHAFLYRCGARLSFESFCKMDDDFINKIGRESYGRQWHRFGRTEQLQKAFEAVNDEEQCSDGVAISNFETFLKVLSICIGAEDEQTRILKHQIRIHTARLRTAESVNLAAEFGCLYDKATYLWEEHHHFFQKKVIAAFWKAYWDNVTMSFKEFNGATMKDVTSFSALPLQLVLFYKQTCRLGLSQETTKIIEQAKDLVRRYVRIMLNCVESGRHQPLEKYIVMNAIAMVTYDHTFCLNFGDLKIAIDITHQRIQRDCERSGRVLSGKDFYPVHACEECTMPLQEAYWTYQTYGCDRCKIKWVDRMTWDTRECTNCKSNGSGIKHVSRKNVHGKRLLVCEAGHEFHIGKFGPWFERPAAKTTQIDSEYFARSFTDPSHYGHLIAACCRLIEGASKVESL